MLQATVRSVAGRRRAGLRRQQDQQQAQGGQLLTGFRMPPVCPQRPPAFSAEASAVHPSQHLLKVAPADSPFYNRRTLWNKSFDPFHGRCSKLSGLMPPSLPIEMRPLTSISLFELPMVGAISKRSFGTKRSLDSSRLASISLLEIKRFLKQKGVFHYHESNACLTLEIPRHLLMASSTDCNETEPDLRWQNVKEAVTKLHVNKTTGGYVCPDLGLAGEWPQLQAFLSALSQNWAVGSQGKSRRGARFDEPALPELGRLPLDRTAAEVKLTWSQFSPVAACDTSTFKEILKYFRLQSKELGPQDFAFHEVKFRETTVPSGNDAAVTGSGDRSFELCFPVRYPNYRQPIGLKLVRMCPETKEIVEENMSLSSMHALDDDLRVLPFVYGLDKCGLQERSKVVLVASVMDALVLTSKLQKKLKVGQSAISPAATSLAGRDLAVVALAHGTTNLPPEHLPFFEQFKEVVFWFPEDIQSSDTVKAFAKKLGEKRCSTVMGHEVPRPFSYLKQIRRSGSGGKTGPELFEEVLRHKVKPCAHQHITTFESLREDVFLELAHFEEVEGVKWKRFDQLNDILRGFRRGELTVFSGRTGSGKTTFMSEYSLDLCVQSVNTLWGSFEVSNNRLAKMQLKQFSAVNLEEHLDKFDSWADKFSKLPMYYLTFHGAQEIEKVLDAMGYAVYVYDIAHVIIDNLQFMMGSTGSRAVVDRFQTQDLIIHKFRKFATLHNVHVTLVIHPRKEDEDKLTSNSIFGGAKATQEADNVVLLQEEEVSVKHKRKYIQVVKNRFSGDLGVVPLFFNRGTLTFSKKVFVKEKSLAKVNKRDSIVPEGGPPPFPGESSATGKNNDIQHNLDVD